MKRYPVMWQFARVVAVVVVAMVIGCALVHSRRGEQPRALTHPARGKAEDRAENPAENRAENRISELARCAAVTPGETELLESCRRIWAEIRQHFFASSTRSQVSVGSAPPGKMFGDRFDDVAPNDVEHVGRR